MKSVDPLGTVTTLSTAFTFAGVGAGAIDVDGAGNIYVVSSSTIRKYDVGSGTWSVFANTGAQTEGIRSIEKIVILEGAPATPIPTLSEWWLILLTLLLVAAGTWLVRRRCPRA